MKIKLVIIISSVLLACNHNDKDTHDSDVKSLVLKSQIDFFDRTIKIFRNQSDIGYYCSLQDSILSSKCIEIKKILQNGETLTDLEQKKLFIYLDSVVDKSEYVNKQLLKQISTAKIQTPTDVDYIELYGKFYFYNILQNFKKAPFDLFGTSVSADSWNIKNGEEFNLELAFTANNADYPVEWFRVKSGASLLDKDNILDTLKMDGNKSTFYNTKNYKTGQNSLKFIVRFKLPDGERQLSRTVSFFVR